MSSSDPLYVKLVNELHKKMRDQAQAITHGNHESLYNLGKLQGELLGYEWVQELILSLGEEEEEDN